MINIRLKRVKRLDPEKYFNPSPLDDCFIEGTLKRLPKKGKSITFLPRGAGLYDRWITTPVEKITRYRTLIAYRTLNSSYHLKKGWRK